MSKREVGKLLRAALAAMNDSGRHWTRGRLKRTRNGEVSFCSIGAINHVTDRPNTESEGYAVDDNNRAVVYALANVINKKAGTGPPRDDHEAVGAIWAYNDHTGRSWPEIEAVFKAAAREPVFPKGEKV